MNNFLIKAPRLYDSVNNKMIEKAAVLFSDGKFVYAGPEESLPETQAETIIYEGCTLLPGLVDAHVHLTMDGNSDPVADTLSDSVPTASFRAMKNAARLINAGITTARDCGCQDYVAVEFANAVERGIVVNAPRILACGPAICMTGGHGYFVGMECDSADEVRKAVRTAIKNGARFIKLMASGGVITNGSATGTTQLDVLEMKTAVLEAQKAGLKTAAHAHNAEGIRLALMAGVDTIEHASYVDDEGVDLFLKTGAMFVSTLLATKQMAVNTREIPEYIVPKILAHIGRESESVRRLIDAGVPAAGGTDAGTPHNPHGGLYLQLIMLSDHGLGNMGALRAGTLGSAQALGMETEIGSLTPGKRADITVVEGNPETGLDALAQVRAVWKDGTKIV